MGLAPPTRRDVLTGLVALAVIGGRRPRARGQKVERCLAMKPDGEPVFFLLIVAGGPGSGEFIYDASGNLRSADVGQTGPDPVQGITCHQGRSTFNGHGAVITLSATNLDAVLLYADTGTSTQGALVASDAPAGGVDPFGNGFKAGTVNYQPGVSFTELFNGSLFIGSLNAGTQIVALAQANLIDTTLASGQPALALRSPSTSGVGVALLTLFGESADSTAPAQAVLAGSPGGPVTSALLEVQGSASPADAAIEVVPHAAGDPALGTRVSGDSINRLQIDGRGAHIWTDGTSAHAGLQSDGNGVMALTNGGGAGTVAGLRLQGNTLPPTPVNGADIWATLGVMHHLGSSGLDGALPAVQTDSTPVTVTAASATPGCKAWSIPAGDANAGTIYRLTTWGFGTNAAGSVVNLTFGVVLAGVQIRSTLITPPGVAGAGFRWRATILLHVATTGSGGTADCEIDAPVSSGSPSTSQTAVGGSPSAGADTINTTIANTLTLGLTWASTTGAPTITSVGSLFERVGP